MCQEFWPRVAELILEKLLVAQLINKFSARPKFYYRIKKNPSNYPYTQPHEYINSEAITNLMHKYF